MSRISVLAAQLPEVDGLAPAATVRIQGIRQLQPVEVVRVPEWFSAHTGSGATLRHRLFKLDSYAALDKMAAEGKDPNTAMGRLLREQTRFLDMSRRPERWAHKPVEVSRRCHGDQLT